MDFTFAHLTVTIRLEEEIADACALFGIRPAFEASFRMSVKCPACQGTGGNHASSCAVLQTFSQAMSPDPEAVRRYQKPPLPFVLALPLLPPPPNRGSTVEFGITLAGTAITHLPIYLAALRGMFKPGMPGRRLPASLIEVASVDYQGRRTPLLGASGAESLDRLVCLSAEGVLETSVLPAERITLEFVTPLRLMQDGRPLRELEFSPLLRALLRRVSAMAYYYGGNELAADYRWLSARSQLIETESAECHWVEWSNRLCGLTGSVTFAGDLSEFHPFLLLGAYLQVGKGAAFGLGRYRIAGCAGSGL